MMLYQIQQKGYDMNSTYFRVHDHIFSHDLSPRDIAVYCCLCKHRNNATGVAFPSRKTIATECGISKAETVDKALKILCEAGLIEKHHQYAPNGGYKSNVYTIPDFGEEGSP